MSREAPAFEPHGALTNIQLQHMTQLTRQHINGFSNPTNVMQDGRFWALYGSKGKQR